MILGLALSLIAVGACSPAPRPIATPEAEPQAGRPEIAAACGGGFTGGSEGVTITSEDHVISWEQATGGASRTETDLGPEPAFAADVRRQLDTIRFADIQFSETGNMTCSLRVGGHNVSWVQGDSRAPSGVVDIHELVFTADGGE